MTEEVQESKKEEEKKEEPGQDLSAALKDFDHSPDQEQIEAWKAQYGDVFVSGFSPAEIFVWRAISRPEWVNLQETAADPEARVDQFRFEEMVCETCVLWKSVKVSWQDGKAGTPSSLQEQILQNSNFLTPQAASMLVQKL